MPARRRHTISKPTAGRRRIVRTPGRRSVRDRALAEHLRHDSVAALARRLP